MFKYPVIAFGLMIGLVGGKSLALIWVNEENSY